jgi:hypothetical protein
MYIIYPDVLLLLILLLLYIIIIVIIIVISTINHSYWSYKPTLMGKSWEFLWDYPLLWEYIIIITIYI